MDLWKALKLFQLVVVLHSTWRFWRSSIGNQPDDKNKYAQHNKSPFINFSAELHKNLMTMIETMKRFQDVFSWVFIGLCVIIQNVLIRGDIRPILWLIYENFRASVMINDNWSSKPWNKFNEKAQQGRNLSISSVSFQLCWVATELNFNHLLSKTCLCFPAGSTECHFRFVNLVNLTLIN